MGVEFISQSIKEVRDNIETMNISSGIGLTEVLDLWIFVQNIFCFKGYSFRDIGYWKPFQGTSHL